MARLVSSGVLVFSAPGRLLVGHSSGTSHWDIPKGLIEPDEAPRAAAARELLEETGLCLDASRWREHGRMPYNKAKDLWLFETPVLDAPLDLEKLVCTSTFIDRFGRITPEFDRFALISRADIAAHCAPAMTRLLLGLQW